MADDRQIMNMGQTVANKSLETMDHIVQALLSMLSEKSSLKGREALKILEEYVNSGGLLTVTECEADSFTDFAESAKTNELTYYAATNGQTGKITIITRDIDSDRVTEIGKELAKAGKAMAKDPQVPLSVFTDSNRLGDPIRYVNIPSYEYVMGIKQKAVDIGFSFAVAKKQDNTYMMIFNNEDLPKAQSANILPEGIAAMYFSSHTDLQDVREIIERRRKEKEQENEKLQEEKERKKAEKRGRE